MSRPSRVLVHPFFFLPETWNGIDEHLLALFRHLDRSRFEPLVLVQTSDGPQTALLAERAAAEAVPAPYVPTAGSRLRLRALSRLYRERGVDVLHLHSPAAGGQAPAALAARLAGVPAVVATYHQIQPHRLPGKARVINRVVHTRLVSAVIAVSRDVRTSLAQHAGVPAAFTRVILNGVDPLERADSQKPAVLPGRRPGEVRIGCFARLSEEKGIACVLEALALLARQVPQAATVIVGDGPERAHLEAQAARLGLDCRVRFLGFQPEARAIMREVDLVVHAPHYEGFGLVMIEAMEAGRPLVVNDAPGGMVEIVRHGETGLIVPAGSPEALSEALVRLAHDPAERRRLGDAGHERWRNRFTSRHMAELTQAMYKELLPTRPRPSRERG